MMDGANKLNLLWDIVAPLSLPTLSVLFVFFFIWNLERILPAINPSALECKHDPCH